MKVSREVSGASTVSSKWTFCMAIWVQNACEKSTGSLLNFNKQFLVLSGQPRKPTVLTPPMGGYPLKYPHTLSAPFGSGPSAQATGSAQIVTPQWKRTAKAYGHINGVEWGRPISKVHFEGLGWNEQEDGSPLRAFNSTCKWHLCVGTSTHARTNTLTLRSCCRHQITLLKNMIYYVYIGLR